MKHILFLSAILLLSSFLGFSQSPVWKIEGNGTSIYIGGSIHLLRNEDYPLPDGFYEAYDNSGILVTELDMNQMKNPANGIKMQQALMYQDEKTLSNILREDVYNKLDSISKDLGLNLRFMDKFKPSMVIISLSFQSLQKLGVTSEGVDAHFTDKAVRDKKPLFFLETFDEQLGFIESMGKGNENEFVLYSIKDIVSNKDEFLDMIEDWKSGQQKLMLDQLEDFRLNYPDIYETMVVKRNTDWMPHLENYFKTSEIEFVVVGAMHLVGPDGILNKLQEKGYKISQL